MQTKSTFWQTRRIERTRKNDNKNTQQTNEKNTSETLNRNGKWHWTNIHKMNIE